MMGVEQAFVLALVNVSALLVGETLRQTEWAEDVRRRLWGDE